MSAVLQPQPRTRRKYSDRERADVLALHDAGLTLTELSEQTGIPDSTLSQWINGRNGLNADTPQLRELSKKSLADKFEDCAHLYLARAVEGEAIAKTSGYYAVKAANEGAVTANLLRGMPTSIVQEVAPKSHLESLRKDFPAIPLDQLAVVTAKEYGVTVESLLNDSVH